MMGVMVGGRYGFGAVPTRIVYEVTCSLVPASCTRPVNRNFSNVRHRVHPMFCCMR